MSLPALRIVSSRRQEAKPRVTRTATLDQTLIAWFDKLNAERQAIVSRLIVDLTRHLVGVRGSEHYLIERGTSYLSAMFGAPARTVQALHMPLLERLMVWLQARRLDPRSDRDRALISQCRASDEVTAPRTRTWIGVHWLITSRARTALIALGAHARTLGHAIPEHRLGPPLALTLGGWCGRGSARSRRAQCPVEPSHGAEVALDAGGSAYCYSCRRELGRWVALAGDRGVQLYPYLDDADEVSAAGSPVDVHAEPTSDPRRYVTRWAPASPYEAERRGFPQRAAGYRYLTGAPRMARRLTPLDAARTSRAPSRATVEASLERLEAGAGDHRDQRVAQGQDLALNLTSDRGQAIGQQWLALSVCAETVPTSDPEIDAAGARGGPRKDPAMRWRSAGDQALARAGATLSAALVDARWGDLSGRIGILRSGPCEATILVELAAMRRDPRALWAHPEFGALLQALASTAEEHLSAQGWSGARVSVPTRPGGHVRLPGWRRVSAGGAWALWRSRLVYGDAEREPEALYVPA